MSIHRRLTLEDHDDERMRPNLSVWTETLVDCEGAKGVVLSVGPSHGGQQRFVELTPAEARKLAKYLTDAADRAETQLFEAAQ